MNKSGQIKTLHGRSWSGASSIQYEIPGDVFAYLLSTDTQNTIGEITCPEDLKRLIDESKKGALLKRSKYTASDKDFPPMTEMKGCGHLCTASSIKEACCGKKFNQMILFHFLLFCSRSFVRSISSDSFQGCCRCSDRRPIRAEGTYPL